MREVDKVSTLAVKRHKYGIPVILLYVMSISNTAILHYSSIVTVIGSFVHHEMKNVSLLKNYYVLLLTIL